MNDMTTEQAQAYKDLWNSPRSTMSLEDIFCAGWDAALAHRPEAVEKHIQLGLDAARSDIRQEIMDKATASFSKGDDEAAMIYRKMANELFGKPAL